MELILGEFNVKISIRMELTSKGLSVEFYQDLILISNIYNIIFRPQTVLCSVCYIFIIIYSDH
jgi:hypothetical protein